MKKSFIALLVLLPSMYASASELTTCTANKGAYLTGTVISAPRFATSSSTRDGIKLTHTRLNLRGSDGRTYDVAMDNVFAVDYVKNSAKMPPSLAAIRVNDQLGLCGAKYPDNTGIHWVHNNCGDVPTASAPNGSVKVISASGSVGANLERSQTYCSIFD